MLKLLHILTSEYCIPFTGCNLFYYFITFVYHNQEKKEKKIKKCNFAHVNNKGKFGMWVIIKAGLRTAYRNTKSVEKFFMTRI